MSNWRNIIQCNECYWWKGTGYDNSFFAAPRFCPNCGVEGGIDWHDDNFTLRTVRIVYTSKRKWWEFPLFLIIKNKYYLVDRDGNRIEEMIEQKYADKELIDG